MSLGNTVSGWGSKIGSHRTELQTFRPFLPTASLHVSIRNLGRFPRGSPAPRTCKSITGPTSTHLQRQRAAWLCLHLTIYLHACDFWFYFKRSHYLNSGALPKYGYVSWNLDFSLLWDFPQVTVWFYLVIPLFHFPSIVCTDTTNN